MSRISWLKDRRTRQDKRNLGWRRSQRGLIRRLNLERLEDRRLLAFDPAASFPVDLAPQAVVTGDFNGDGHLDLATANPAADTVSVLLGDGAGGFGDAIDTSVIVYGAEVGFDSVFLTAADFNNDGKDDLAVQTHVLLLSNGDGTFAPRGTSAASWWPVAAGDFNNDGNIDLVYSETAWSGIEGEVIGERIRVLPGDGHGGFGTARTSYYPDEYAWYGSLAVGDLNGDGNLDVVTLNGDYVPGGRVFVGDGTGRFTGSQLDMPGLAAAVAIGDLTADGIPDIIHVSRSNSDLVSVQVGRGDGTFGFPINGYSFDYGTVSLTFRTSPLAFPRIYFPIGKPTLSCAWLTRLGQLAVEARCGDSNVWSDLWPSNATARSVIKHSFCECLL